MKIVELTMCSFFVCVAEFTKGGTIPASIGLYTSLTHLGLCKFFLFHLEDWFCGYFQIWHSACWNVEANIALIGSIPTEIGQLTQLSGLDLVYNGLSGSIPTEIGQLTLFTLLSLSYNDLTGSIPKEFDQLNQLIYIFLHNNDLTGSIPTEIEMFSNLDTINLSGNRFVSNMNPLFCNSTYTTNFNDEKFPSLDDLVADCAGDDPKVICDCCTRCN